VPRPRSPLLSRRLVAETALALIDADGLEALTMRALARRLGVEAASIYHHFASRDDVLDEAIGLINETVPLPARNGNGAWQAELAAFARGYHDAFAAHPEMVAVAMRRPITTPAALRIYDYESAVLLDAGFTPERASTILAALDHLVLGSALEAFAAGFDQPAAAYGPAHAQLVRVLEGNDPVTLPARSFELGLEAFLIGLGEPR
jgi:AcrR family transcriptional regulator